MSAPILRSEAMEKLPKPWSEALSPQIRAAVLARPNHKLVVLDDDPTGTQTVYDLPVLTTWEIEELRNEFSLPDLCFYLLTNSRSLPASAAERLILEVVRNLKAAAGHCRMTVVSRGDSTLRGHYPLETDLLQSEFGPYDATILIPYFEAGGRHTIGDIHYVAEKEWLVPAAETPFAKDAAFGYRSSNLRNFIEEKTNGKIPAARVASISLETIRVGGPLAVYQQMREWPMGSTVVVNAAAPSDLEVFVLGMLRAEASGKRYLCRTAAQFIATRLGLPGRDLWEPIKKPRNGNRVGGLSVVGSYVPKTTEQLGHLRKSGRTVLIELAAPILLKHGERDRLISETLNRIAVEVGNGKDVVLATTREVIGGSDVAESLEIGNRISSALVEIVRRLPESPRYLIAKGGITSSDLATKGLGVKRARVLGQILPGVPVWELGMETKFPGLPYVVFPGNVGSVDALERVIDRFS